MSQNNNSPKINSYIENLYEELGSEENSFYVFRGQASAKYPLECTAFRRNNIDRTEEWLKDNQKKLIDDMKMKGFGHFEKTQRELYDLELLADLRHYGAPSCLIDFTSDF